MHPFVLPSESDDTHSREKWRLLDLEFEDPYLSMAVEEAIARNVGENKSPCTLRLWRNLNAVVIGANQDLMSEVNLAPISKYGTRIIRRFTGGGAVYQDAGNLNFAVSLPIHHRLVNEDIIETFRTISSGVVRGLQLLGLNDVQFNNENSIDANGFKVSGLAGCVRWGTFFCHGSILVSSDIRKLVEVLSWEPSSSAKYVQSSRRTVTTVSREIGREVSMREAKRALTKGFEDTFELAFVDGKLGPEEIDVTIKLLHEKYSVS